MTVSVSTVINGSLVAVDTERDSLTYRIASDGTLGTVTLENAASGAFSYTAGASAGTDTFTFIASDGRLDSNVATVTITVGASTLPPPVNAPPIAVDGSLTVAPGATAQGMFSASDSDGEPLTYRVVTAPAGGTVSVTSAGVFNYSANAGVTGTDSFTFVANDGAVDSNVATMTVTYAASNTPPISNPGVLTVVAGATATGALTATDDNGDKLAYAMVADARKGELSINAATGAYTYTAAANATGTDSFTFKASDGQTDSAAATVAITITNVNAPPSANPGVLSVVSGGRAVGRLAANDPDGDLVSFTVKQLPTQGTVTITDRVTGAFQYVANPNAAGTDTFTFTATDGRTASAPATVNVMLADGGGAVATPSAPQVRDLSLQVDSTGSISAVLPVSNNTGANLTFEIVRQTGQGQVTLNPSTGAFNFRAVEGANGVDSFNYRVATGSVVSNTAVVKLTFARAANAPSANAGGEATSSRARSGSGGGGVVSVWWLGVVAMGGIVMRRRR